MSLTLGAVRAHPAVQTHWGPRRLAAIVAKVVVAGDAQFVALDAEVVLVTSNPEPVGDTSHGPVVQDGLPGVAGVDHAGVSAALD